MADGTTVSVLRNGRILGRLSQNDLVLAARQGRLLPTDELRDEQSGKVTVAGQVPWLSFDAGVVVGGRPITRDVQGIQPPGVQSSAPHRAGPPPKRPAVSMPPPFVAPPQAAAQRAGPTALPGLSPIAPQPKSGRSGQGLLVALTVAGAGGLFVLVVLGIVGTVMLSRFLAYDPHVALVRDGSLSGCPGRTVGAMADSFLENPSWESIEIDGSHYVNLSGGMTYKGSPAFTELQFEIDGSTFRLRSMEINGEGQPLLVQAAMIRVMCDSD
jgi:hypothetical protein